MDKFKDIPPCLDPDAEGDNDPASVLFDPTHDELDEIFRELSDEWEEFGKDITEEDIICPCCLRPEYEHTEFIFHFEPDDIEHDEDDSVLSCSHEEYFVAFWVKESREPKCVVSGPQNRRWVLCTYEREPEHAWCIYGKHFRWRCLPVTVSDPCDDEFMKEISS